MAVSQVITDLPTPPSSSDVANFITRSDAFVLALDGLQGELNTAIGQINSTEVNMTALEASAEAFALTAINAPATQATSTTSLTIGTGTKSLTIQTNKSLVVGMSLKVASTTSPTNWMVGDITSYNSGTGALSVSVSGTQGSGTFADWTVSLASTTASAVAETANTLTTPRTINGVAFDGSSNINIEDRMGSSINCATTTTIGTAGLGETIHLTGTTTITSFGVSTTGTRRTLICDGTGTITHNSTSLICMGAASITKKVGMSLEVVCENGALGYWRVVSITDPDISATELSQLNGVTSSIQTQIDSKLTTPTTETSYTPVITGSVSNGTFTYASQIGRYVSLGNVRIVYFQVVWSSATVGSGDVRISLPSVVDSSAIMRGSVSLEGVTFGADYVVCRGVGGQSYLTLNLSTSNSADTQIQHSALSTTGGTIVGTLTYFT